MSTFFSKLDKYYTWFNDEVYKYLLFLYYLGKVKKPLYLILMGILAGLSLPPFNLFFLLPFAFASVIRMTDFCDKPFKAFKVGFWFCYGFNLSSLYWISFSVLHDKSFVWLFPFALFGIPIVVSLFQAIIFPIYHKVILSSSAIKKIIIFSSLWVLFEYLRGVIFQFPWNFIGYSFTFSVNILQITSIFGILGLSFFVVLWASSFHLFMLTGDKDDFVKYFKFILFTNILLILFFVFGIIKIAVKPKPEVYKDIMFRLVQGNVPPSGKLTDGYDENLEKYINLTTSKSLENIDYIIWPEGAINSLAYNNKQIRSRLSALLTGEQLLLTGTMRFEGEGKNFKVFNSLAIINSKDGASYYDKNYLVPFGEFVPFKKLIPIPAVANAFHDFSRGSGMETMKTSSKVPPFSPLICYEVAFSGSIANREVLNPEWILNITNDAWYGFSSGPFQHLQIARVRAIEEGLPLIRVANNGISAVYDDFGRRIAKLPLLEEGILDVKLPKQQEKNTIFGILGNFPMLLFLICYVLYIIGDYIYIIHDRKINATTRKMLKDGGLKEKKPNP